MARRNPRAIAAEMLRHVVVNHRSIDRVLGETTIAEADRALVQEFVYGSVRHYFSLSAELEQRLLTPLKPRDAVLHCLLLIGLYQLRHLRIPPYAAVNETVNATVQIGRPWSRALVNRLLRRAAADQATTASIEDARLNHPAWLVERVKLDYPNAWREIFDASMTRAPMSLRVNLAATSRDRYLEELTAIGVVAQPAEVDEGVVLAEPISVERLPGFAEGRVSVQDLSAMCPARLLDAASGERVLDACAAPGGKSMHLIERQPRIALTSLDVDEARCETLRAEFRRCRRDPAIVARGDATQLDWWDGRPYNAILVDAPCSGTGTLRRHPDIKVLKRAADIPQYRRRQGELLSNLWKVLEPGGRLLYCTCSILSEENDVVVADFVDSTRDASVQALSVPRATQTKYGRQLLPEIGGGDGFYFALLKKSPA